MSESSGWSRGYPVGETYPASWHSFQSPAHLRAVCAVMGVAWEVGAQTPLCVAEIGCGTGYTSHVLAAGNPHWTVIGLDYNPAHIAEARSMAMASGLDNLRFIEADLAELGDEDLDRLPEFDLITVHGLWSWVDDPVREGVLRLLRRRLKAGGLALVSYNALPGAAGALGLSRVVRAAMLSAGNSIDGTAQATRVVEQLVAAEPVHLPQSTWRRLLTGELKGARPGYLMHEFQTEHWRPSFQADMASAMASARCEYVGSATIDENFPHLSLSTAQRALWDAAPDSAARELIFDLCVPRAFRRDLYVRGLRRVPRDPAVDALWLASASRAQGAVMLQTQAGQATLPQQMIDSARAALAEGPCTVAQLRALPGCSTVTPSELLAVLVGSNCAVPLWRQPGSGADWDQAVAAARRMNAVAAERLAPFGIGVAQLGLATPALAGGLTVTPMELAVARLVVQSAAQGDWLPDATTLVRRLVPPGSTPEPAVQAELERIVNLLLTERAPVWKDLGIV